MVSSKGYIYGVDLNTPPKSQSTITISNFEVHQEYSNYRNLSTQPLIISVQKAEGQPMLIGFKDYLLENNLVKHIDVKTSFIKDVTLTTPPSSAQAQIFIGNAELIQEYFKFVFREQQFLANKNDIQTEFLKSLNDLKKSPSHNKQPNLYGNLEKAQKQFFEALTPGSSKTQVEAAVATFRTTCEQHITAADKIMGHGWAYRIIEVVLKAVVGLFASIGMVLGAVVGQGIVKEEHRQAFKKTFLSFNQTEATKSLHQFKQEILGNDDKDAGILDSEKINPKKM